MYLKLLGFFKWFIIFEKKPFFWSLGNFQNEICLLQMLWKLFKNAPKMALVWLDQHAIFGQVILDPTILIKSYWWSFWLNVSTIYLLINNILTTIIYDLIFKIIIIIIDLYYLKNNTLHIISHI
jgi:hypothetical protein